MTRAATAAVALALVGCGSEHTSVFVDYRDGRLIQCTEIDYIGPELTESPPAMKRALVEDCDRLPMHVVALCTAHPHNDPSAPGLFEGRRVTEVRHHYFLDHRAVRAGRRSLQSECGPINGLLTFPSRSPVAGQ